MFFAPRLAQACPTRRDSIEAEAMKRTLLSRRLFSRTLAIAALVPLAACATTGDDNYPDLAPRAVEGRLTTVPPEPVALPPPPPPAADLAGRIAQLDAQAEAAKRRFAAALPATQAAVDRARGAAVSSEAWVSAQAAISVLESERGPATDALAEVDALLITRTESGERAGLDELAELRDRLIALVAAQQTTIKGLLAVLRSA